MADAVLETVFPPSCMFCGKVLPPGDLLGTCGDCGESLWRLHPPYCRACGKPFSEGEVSRVCQDCALDPPHFDVLRVPFGYSGPLRDALTGFKFNRVMRNARPLAGLLLTVAGMGIDWRDYDLAVPVPLHVKRLRERGFNQSLLLARRLLAKTNLPVRYDILVRVKPTVPQVGLTRAKRQENVRAAFSVVRAREVAGRKILLVDDIVTTGATMSACAKALKKAGAASVDAIAVARAIELHSQEDF